MATLLVFVARRALWEDLGVFSFFSMGVRFQCFSKSYSLVVKGHLLAHVAICSLCTLMISFAVDLIKGDLTVAVWCVIHPFREASGSLLWMYRPCTNKKDHRHLPAGGL